MRHFPCLIALLLLLPLAAQAGVRLTVKGVDDPLKTAVQSGVAISQYANRPVSEAQVRRLYDEAPAEVRAALEPYGYYEASVQGTLTQAGADDWRVTLTVKPGEPVRITQVRVKLDEAALKIAPIRRAERAVERLKGAVLNHGAYEKARDDVSAALTANGFLGARLVTHKVAVTRADRSAVVELAWLAGPRYRFGKVEFKGSQFDPGFLDRYVPFHRGEYFDQADLLVLQEALNGADYFSVVNVLPNVDDGDRTVDVDVQLQPAKRSVYTGGPFFGTDTGVGVRVGVERRWINSRGHKWKNELVLAQRLKTLSTLYTIPLPGSAQRSLNFGANFRDANTVTSQSRTLELVGNETELWHGWTRTVGAHAVIGTFTVGKRGNEPDNAPGIEHGRSKLVFAEASLSRKHGDNPTFVRHGWSLSVYARSTAGTLLSSTRFSQLAADAKWIDAFSRRDRLILRASAGITSTGDFSALPPQLRFFAGGDRSVRGYGYQAIGPRNSFDRVIGGRNLLVASTEVEHYFTRNWGMAAFVDAGNAFNGTDYRPRIGAGLGVRWLSPVGMIRVDVGTPIHDDHAHGIQLHVVIGPDL
ncbi:autotransporter assembly complex protein TamA [Frateuria terrea]|uniref:Translocation and assembly module subunit TamA n=1 Tax=Frateuria terrea TaxID=529704 RepID=A0A1H6YV50_9GAMM|nr:autotransporter assembly complex family protein [Frateuria terrea]SEJ40695.1 autotransporter secretion outer membrane protein TamA [Frateuria terrea]SFP74812.1 autotransporter secretion outer membrane protein TamA [Frateuria terrea]